ncbi:MAG TPA: tetratricopeptide repeat protein [Polyangiaceae bacterium]|nr:tetratricopeptide repeat protein [Polyangiaceae bacterium]
MASAPTAAEASASSQPVRAVVVPFAVPEEARDLGVGLAALIHTFARVEGESVALAQLLTREPGAEARAVEALVSPATWRELSGRAPSEGERVSVVLTGVLEPPLDGRGHLQLVAFDAATGRRRAEQEVSLDAETAGASVLRAVESLCEELSGEASQLADLAELDWEALEGVLRAERCILHNPLRGGPHDRLAALLHLGRAVADAPGTRLPASRLASVALDAVLAQPTDTKVAAASLRALERAIDDAPTHPDLREAAAALRHRAGDHDAAEAHVLAALETHPERPRLYALLSEARRGRGDLAGAEEAIDRGLARCPLEPSLLTERGALALARGEPDVARARFSEALERAPGHPAALLSLLEMGARSSDPALLEEVAFRACAVEGVPVDVLRRTLRLYGGLASGSAPRAAAERAGCLRRLAERVVRDGPDPWAELTLARAELELGLDESARAHLSRVEASAPDSALAAEARRARFALDHPQTARDLEEVVREAPTQTRDELAASTERARALASENDVWTAHFALGLVERRRERWEQARAALELALAKSPGATPAHIELVAVHVALGRPTEALAHADRACALEGESARTHAVRATALLAAKRHADARDAIQRALALDANDADHRALADRIHASLEPVGAFERLRQALRFKKR